MTKVLFILSAIVIGVAAFFAYSNGQEFAKARNEAIAKNRQVETQRGLALKADDENKKVAGEVAAVEQELTVESEKKKAQQLRIAQADNEARRLQEELDAKNRKLEELKLILTGLPQGVKVETLQEDVNKLKTTIAELQNQAETKKKDVEAEEEKVVVARKALDDIVRKIEERKKSFDRNSLTARVVAVNNDWGFVVIDAGKSQGIDEATKLLVTRGTQIIGKLSIISVQGARTVANILVDSLAQGQAIQPGDRVILENLYE